MHLGPRPEIFALLAALAGGVAGWGTPGREAVGGVERTSKGAARFEIVNAPLRAMCVRITVVGGRTDVRLFPVLGEADATVEVDGLPAGRDTVSAETFSIPCGLVSDRATRNGHSAPTVGLISVGDTARLDLVMIRDHEARLVAHREH